MDLLIAANTVTQAQADTAPATGTPGWATDGNPATGLLATDAPAWHYNMMMSELIGIIKAAGITPSNADWSQVLKAMQTIFAPAQYGVAPFSASLAQLIGGYPLGAIVFDAAGNYWRSTKANNLTVPGAENANWVNFFAGVMTQQQADLRYLMLSGGNVTGAMDWGSKTAAVPLTHRYWSAGPPAEGDATPDATLTIAGGTPGTANKGTMALSTGVLDLSETGKVLAPDATEFDGKQVVNAGVADGRYVKSIPVSPNKRITDIWENADGRTVTGDGSGSNVLASLSDLPTSGVLPGDGGGGYRIQIGNILIQSFWVESAWDGLVVPFPVAFLPGTIPIVLGVAGTTSSDWTGWFGLGTLESKQTKVTNTGITLSLPVQNGSNGGLSYQNDPLSVNILLMGRVG